MWDEDDDATSRLYTSGSHILLATGAAGTDGLEWKSENGDIQTAMTWLQNQFSGFRLDWIGASDDAGRLLVEVQKSDRPNRYLIVAPETLQIVFLPLSFPALAEKPFSMNEPMKLPFGATQPVRITRPPSGVPIKSALIVPMIDDDMRRVAQKFVPQDQILASVGIVVVHVDLAMPTSEIVADGLSWHRRSADYLARVAAALRGELPKLPICVGGMAEAGYMALVAASLQTKAFDCVVARETNLQPDLVGTTDFSYYRLIGQSVLVVGTISDRYQLRLRALLEDATIDAGVGNDPTQWADILSAPVLLIFKPYSDGAVWKDADHSSAFRKAMKRHKRTVKYYAVAEASADDDRPYSAWRNWMVKMYGELISFVNSAPTQVDYATGTLQTK